MLPFLFRRLGQSALVIAAMATLVFVGVYAIGNPIDILISPEADETEGAPATPRRGRARRCERAARPRPAAVAAVPGVRQIRPRGRPRPLVRARRAGARIDPPAHAGDIGAGVHDTGERNA